MNSDWTPHTQVYITGGLATAGLSRGCSIAAERWFRFYVTEGIGFCHARYGPTATALF